MLLHRKLMSGVSHDQARQLHVVNHGSDKPKPHGLFRNKICQAGVIAGELAMARSRPRPISYLLRSSDLVGIFSLEGILCSYPSVGSKQIFG
jgi:hypothetical protein